MTDRRKIVLVLECGTRTDEAMRAGVEFARIFDRNLRAVFIEPAETLAAWRAYHGACIGMNEHALQSVMHHQRTRVRAALASSAAAAGIAAEFLVSREPAAKALEDAAAPGDLAVLTMDLSDPGPDRIASIASVLRARELGAAFVPETRPATRGDVVAADEALRAHETVARLAAAFAARTLVWMPEDASSVSEAAGARSPQSADQAAVENAGKMIYPAAGPRLFVLAHDHIQSTHLAAALGRVRRHRATLLVLASASAATTPR